MRLIGQTFGFAVALAISAAARGSIILETFDSATIDSSGSALQTVTAGEAINGDMQWHVRYNGGGTPQAATSAQNLVTSIITSSGNYSVDTDTFVANVGDIVRVAVSKQSKMNFPAIGLALTNESTGNSGRVFDDNAFASLTYQTESLAFGYYTTYANDPGNSVAVHAVNGESWPNNTTRVMQIQRISKNQFVYTLLQADGVTPVAPAVTLTNPLFNSKGALHVALMGSSGAATFDNVELVSPVVEDWEGTGSTVAASPTAGSTLSGGTGTNHLPGGWIVRNQSNGPSTIARVSPGENGTDEIEIKPKGNIDIVSATKQLGVGEAVSVRITKKGARTANFPDIGIALTNRSSGTGTSSRLGDDNTAAGLRYDRTSGGHFAFAYEGQGTNNGGENFFVDSANTENWALNDTYIFEIARPSLSQFIVTLYDFAGISQGSYTANVTGSLASTPLLYLDLQAQASGTTDAYQFDNIKIWALPEPGGLALISLGLLGLARRKR